MRIKFWGTRGLISSPRHDTAIFGGNTPCIQILHEDQLILVDTGFGVSNFGESLLPRILEAREELDIHIIYTHFHWDHIQGLPFFQPIYFANTKLHLYSPLPKNVTFNNLDLLFDGSYSPFEGLMNMDCDTSIHQLTSGFDLGGLKISFTEVDHGEPGPASLPTYAYRFTAQTDSGEQSLCIVTDHEARPGPINDQVVALTQDCDLLVHDGQYTDDEYQNAVGFGHSTAKQALENALQSSAGFTLLTHHHPTRSDREMQILHRQLMTIERFRSLSFEFAREETEYALQQLRNPPKASKAS